jgi:hypothetical protein
VNSRLCGFLAGSGIGFAHGISVWKSKMFKSNMGDYMLKMTTILSLVLVSSTVITSNAFAANEVLKTCTTDIKVPGNNLVVPTTYQIVNNGSALTAKTTQVVDGTVRDLPDEAASVADFSVRPGLTADTANMNQAEHLIQSTEELLATPEFGSSFSVGVDLKKISSAKVYQIGKFTHMGGTVIIEAHDKDGKEMGSFVNGFLPFACKK